MKKNKRAQHATGFIDKIVDHSISLVLTFLFVTALLGSSSYILFQFPTEKDAYDRKKGEYANNVAPIRRFNDMLNVFASGWFADPTVWQPREIFIPKLFKNLSAPSLDPNFKQELLNWVGVSRPRLTSEKGNIAGFVLKDEFERAYQKDFLNAYEIQVSLVKQLEDVVLDWEQEQPKSRAARLASMQVLIGESVANMQSIITKVDQLKDQLKVEQLQADQTARELRSQIRIMYVKYILAIMGITIGVTAGLFVGRAAIKKNARK